MGVESDQGARIATNLRTLLILEEVAGAGEPLTPTEINRAIGLPKQSIHRLCQTMISEGFLVRDETGKKLLPAPRAMTMAKGLLNSRHHKLARHQVLISLSRATGETVNFAMPEIDGMAYVDRVETDWHFRIELPVGSRVPFHCTASGKCYLASLPSRTLEQVLKTLALDRSTPNTICGQDELREELGKIRQNGYAIDSEELFEGMVALGVPVHDNQGNFLATVSFHGPTQRLNLETLVQHLDLMRDGARQLSEISS